MRDSFQREIDYMRVSVTDRCNLRCAYCMPKEGIADKLSHAEILRDEEIVDIVEVAAARGVKKIRLTGGEPLVRKGIVELIKKIRAVEGIEELVLTTNGILLQGRAQELKAAGIDRVNLSVDSLEENTYRDIVRQDARLDVEALVRELKEASLTPIKLNCVLLRGVNEKEVGAFIDLAAKHDITVRFIELMPFQNEGFRYETHFLGKDEVLRAHPRLEFVKKEKIAEYYTIAGKKGRIGFIDPVSHKFCRLCNRIRLTADGHLKTCLLSDAEYLVKGLEKEALIRRFEEAIKAKPPEHALEKGRTRQKRTMNRIGG